MSNSLELKIKVDQSHCNYQLSQCLTNLGWIIVFRDPGRVSRGLSGNQEIALGVFERHALPIPDIVATIDESLLLIEVDANPWSNESSFNAYRTNFKLIISELASGGAIGKNVKTLLLGFCKVGIAKNTVELQRKLSVNLIVTFEDQLNPTLLWSRDSILTL